MHLCAETYKSIEGSYGNRDLRVLQRQPSLDRGSMANMPKIWGAKDFLRKNGASEGIRTLDTHVGNVMLYQAELRSLPESGEIIKPAPPDCKCSFVSG